MCGKTGLIYIAQKAKTRYINVPSSAFAQDQDPNFDKGNTMQELTTFLSNHSYLTIAAIVVFILVTAVEVIRTRRNTFHLSSQQTTQKINHENAVVIDIRSNEAYRKGHIIDAQSIAANDIREGTKKLERFKNRPLIIVCNTGTESQKIAALLIKQGYNAYS